MDQHDIARFVAVTNCPAGQAEFYLGASDGNFDRAVALYYEQQQHVASPRAPRIRDPSIPPRPARGPTSLGVPPPRRRGLAALLLSLPTTLVRTAFNVTISAVSISFSLLNVLGSRLLPSNVMNALRGLFAALMVRRQEMDATAAATLFIDQFAQQHGPIAPRWLSCSWLDATSRAHASYKFLFVYLHCPGHQDANQFCRETLCHPDVVAYVNQTFLCWGGDVRMSDAYRLSTSLRVTRYPYVCLLALSGTNLRLVSMCEGLASPSQLLQVLTSAHEQHSGVLVAEQVAAQELNWNRRLREEQDAEYQRSLEADRAREQEQEASRQRAEEARLREEAVQRKQREVEEARQRAAEEAAAAIERRRRDKRAMLPAEPVMGAEGGCTVRVRLPDGSHATRRFLTSAPLCVVCDFVETLEEMHHLHFTLINTFPRKEYGQEDMHKSLEELGLAPSAALFVQPIAND